MELSQENLKIVFEYRNVVRKPLTITVANSKGG